MVKETALRLALALQLLDIISTAPTFMCKDSSKLCAAIQCLCLGVQDPRTNNPTYQIFYPENETLSTPLVLTILMESNPVNTYPFAIVMPTGSTLIIAGDSLHATPWLIPGPCKQYACANPSWGADIYVLLLIILCGRHHVIIMRSGAASTSKALDDGPMDKMLAHLLHCARKFCMSCPKHGISTLAVSLQACLAPDGVQDQQAPSL